MLEAIPQVKLPVTAEAYSGTDMVAELESTAKMPVGINEGRGDQVKTDGGFRIGRKSTGFLLLQGNTGVMPTSVTVWLLPAALRPRQLPSDASQKPVTSQSPPVNHCLSQFQTAPGARHIRCIAIAVFNGHPVHGGHITAEEQYAYQQTDFFSLLSPTITIGGEPYPGTCSNWLWLLPSGPDQIHQPAMRGRPANSFTLKIDAGMINEAASKIHAGRQFSRCANNAHRIH